MRPLRFIACVCCLVLVGSWVHASPPNLALAEDGTLYRTVSYSNMFALRIVPRAGNS